MRYIIAAALLTIAPQAANAEHLVPGYYTQNGTYVEPHYQTDPNATKLDNYSSQGNVNPHNGHVGTVDPYRPVAPPLNSYGVNRVR